MTTVKNISRPVCYCGKRCFGSRSAARYALRKAGNRIRLYICTMSGTWHVTSSHKEEEYR